MKENIAYVTAIYKIDSRSGEYVKLLWERLHEMSVYAPNLHVFCSAEEEEEAPPLPETVTIHRQEFKSLRTHDILADARGLPPILNAMKDTTNFMILMNAKTEFIKILKDLFLYNGEEEPSHFVWLDAGLLKVVKSPSTLFPLFFSGFNPESEVVVTIPGILEQKKVVPLNHVHWRFCGGVCVVPFRLVDSFYKAVLAKNEVLAQHYDLAVWEVNIWALLENESFPLRQVPAGHNGSILLSLLSS